jgi:hypothetical protein
LSIIVIEKRDDLKHEEILKNIKIYDKVILFIDGFIEVIKQSAPNLKLAAQQKVLRIIIAKGKKNI